MNNNFLYLDFEYRKTAEPQLDLVAVALRISTAGEVEFEGSFWLRDPDQHRVFTKLLRPYLETHTIVSYAFTAEARCLFDIYPDLRPGDLKAYDLYLNYRLLLNHNDALEYGRQLIDGRIKVTKKPKPKYERTEEDDLDDSSKPQYGLAAAVFKLLNEVIDTDQKTNIRNLIIHGSEEAVDNSVDSILKYAEADIKYLPKLLAAEHQRCRTAGMDLKDIHSCWSNMAEYAARTAWMERIGYPVNVVEIERFANRIPELLNAASLAVNEEAPAVSPFQLNKKTGLYIKKEAPIRAWVTAHHDAKSWKQTDGGKPSLSIDAFRRHYDSESEGFPGAMVRYLKTKQSLNGFSPSKGKRGNFFDYLGSDGRARPYFGIYGSQSSRSQPSATGFLPLKAHWMRYFIDPPPGRAITGVDYASQEFLIAALLAEDEAMVEAYRSGDVYLAFGKTAGFIPAGGTKETHGKQRDIFKTLVLGISYDMSAVGLARRLTQVTKEAWTDERASGLIETFYDIYSSYAEWKREMLKEYEDSNELSLRDGWRMWGDNDNHRSVGNFPVQGAGAAIMRRAVAKLQEDKIHVIYTLHDAIYCEHAQGQQGPGSPDWMECRMKEAFMEYFDNAPGSEAIRMDAFTWGRGLPNDRYVDEKGRRDLERYKHFFN